MRYPLIFKYHPIVDINCTSCLSVYFLNVCSKKECTEFGIIKHKIKEIRAGRTI